MAPATDHLQRGASNCGVMRVPALRGTQLRAPGPGPVRIHPNPSVPTVPSTTVGDDRLLAA